MTVVTLVVATTLVRKLQNLSTPLHVYAYLHAQQPVRTLVKWLRTLLISSKWLYLTLLTKCLTLSPGVTNLETLIYLFALTGALGIK